MTPRNLVLLVLGGFGLLILANPDIFANQSVVPPETPDAMPNSNPLFTGLGSGAAKPASGLATVNWALGKDGLFSDSTSYGAGATALASDILRYVQGTAIGGQPTLPNVQQVPNYTVGGARIPLVSHQPMEIAPYNPGLPPNRPIPAPGGAGFGRLAVM